MSSLQTLRTLHVSGPQISCLIEAARLRFDRPVVVTWLSEGTLYIRAALDTEFPTVATTTLVAVDTQPLSLLHCVDGARVALAANCTHVRLTEIHGAGASTFAVDPLLSVWTAEHLHVSLSDRSTATLGPQQLGSVSLSLRSESHVLSVSASVYVSVEAESGCSFLELPRSNNSRSTVPLRRGLLGLEEALNKTRAQLSSRCSSPPPPVFSHRLAHQPVSPGPMYASECLICVAPATRCTMPCRHAIMCEDCWRQRTDTPSMCPMCRADVQNYARCCTAIGDG
jgi:hypothetical protein